jgi:hypothetical protein
VAQDFSGDSGDQDDFSRDNWPRGLRDPRDPRDSIDPNIPSDRWPDEMPSVEVAHVVLKVDESITLKRTAAAAWLTAHGDAVPSLPITPTRMELAILIALAETYGPMLYNEARFVPVIDFIADNGAVKFVQRVMYGARPVTDFDVTAYAAQNTRLADTVRDARVAFEFLCATWPEVFLAQTHAALAGIGVRVRPPDADLVPPSNDAGGPKHRAGEHAYDEHNDRDEHNDHRDDEDDGEGDHA